MTVQPKVIKWISNSSLGAGLSSAHAERLAELANYASVAAGSSVFCEGDTARCLRMIIDGRVALEMHVPTRGSVRIATLGPRDILGWSALVGDGHMSATAVALENTQLLEFPASDLHNAGKDDPSLGRSLMTHVAQSIASRLKQTRLQLLDLFADTATDPP